MKLLYYQQPLSDLYPDFKAGALTSKVLKSDYDGKLEATYYRGAMYNPDNEVVIYSYLKKNGLFKDDYTYFINLGEYGLFISYLISLKKEYTLDSILNQIKGIDLRSFVKKEYFESSQKGCYVRSKGALLYIESKNVGSKHWGINETHDLPFYAHWLVQQVREVEFDNSKLVALPPKQETYNNDYQIPGWAKFCIKAGIRIGVAMIAGYIGSQIDIGDVFGDSGDSGDSGDIGDLGDSFGSDLSDFETNGMFDSFDIGDDGGDITSATSQSNISFGRNLPPNHLSDGYIFQGGQKFNGFQVYTKQGHTYYWDHIKDIWVKIK